MKCQVFAALGLQSLEASYALLLLSALKPCNLTLEKHAIATGQSTLVIKNTPLFKKDSLLYYRGCFFVTKIDFVF